MHAFIIQILARINPICQIGRVRKLACESDASVLCDVKDRRVLCENVLTSPTMSKILTFN